jgi:DNA-binding MarR family transcriptional regulator
VARHGRRNVVAVTAAGVEKLRELDVVLGEVRDDLLGSLSDRDREELVRLLARVLVSR